MNKVGGPAHEGGPQPYSPSEGSPCTASQQGEGWSHHQASGGYTPSAPSRRGQTWQKEIISVEVKILTEPNTKAFSEGFPVKMSS